MIRKFTGENQNPFVRFLLPFIALSGFVVLLFGGCGSGSEGIVGEESYFSNFESADELKNWKSSDSGKWEIKDGSLVGDAHITERRSILWLDRVLVEDIQVEFEAECLENAYDLNCFLCGNGKNYSGYEIIIGGFGNQYIAVYRSRIDDNGDERKRLAREEFQIEKKRVYAVKVQKIKGTIKVYIDKELVLSAMDKEPFNDAEHRYFGFSTFENVVRYDNLKIEKKD